MPKTLLGILAMSLSLLDCQGNVVGVVQMTLKDATHLQETGTTWQNVNYALKSSCLLAFLKPVSGLTLAEPQRAAGGVGEEAWVSDALPSVVVVLVH
jgi:hypothetical protein